MKNLLTFLFVLLLCISSANAFEFDGDNVHFDREEEACIDVLNEQLSRFFPVASKMMPESVRAEMMNIKPTDFSKTSEKTIAWLEQNLNYENDVDLLKAVKVVEKFSKIHAVDVEGVVWGAFWEYLHKQRLKLPDKVANYIILWREENSPNIKLSPNGLGEINWLWKLPSTRKRKYGILHVGIDLKKRTFICFESDIGLYFPEGETMERIYTEIVQEPNMAGIFVGKGFTKSR